MSTRILALLSAACLAVNLSAPAIARSTSPRGSQPAGPVRVATVDFDRRLDVNRMALALSNFGAIGYDIATSGGGFWYPAGTSRQMLFASGLWLGANVNGSVRIAVSEYASEFRPGPMAGAGPGDPQDPAHSVWKVKRWTGDPLDSAHVERAPGDSQVDVLVHHSWSEYMAGAAPDGAPWRLHRLPVTATPDPADSLDVPGPDLPGDLAMWCVFNDADPAAHVLDLGGTAPLGAEIEQVVFGFDDPGPVGDVAFVRWRIRNASLATWADLHAGFWLDPDVGSFLDDKVGCDSSLSVGFAYNAGPLDDIYGASPPVLGAALLGSSPAPRLGSTAGMHAFGSYVNGTDPTSAEQTYNTLSGLLPDGNLMTDPIGNPTRYRYSGNPLTGSGWLDPVAADKRMLVSAAPRHVDPGDTLELWAALVVAPEPGVTAALNGITCRTSLVRAVFEAGFARPFPSADLCETPRNCPRPAGYWSAQCEGDGSYTQQSLAEIASMISQHSVALDFGAAPLAGMCATLTPGADVRQQAYREYTALLANVMAVSSGLHPTGEMPIALGPPTPVNCLGIPAVNVGELAAPGAESRTVSGTYQNFVLTNRRPIEGVDLGLSGFNGGAGSMFDFFGSSLNPRTMPDSFPPLVRIRFDIAQPQKAYRYLRNELADGSPPFAGRGYRYAGFVDVPFSVRDQGTGEQLDVGFVERVVTDESGTIQPGASQPASFDSTWGPTSEEHGGREYLFVSRRPYTGAPRAEFAADGAAVSETRPWLFALWARLRQPTDVFDAGDAFDFGFGYPFTTGVDALLRDLAGQSLSDPAVAAQYAQISACLGAITRGETVGPLCDEPTPALVTLVSAEAEPGLVRVEWHLAAPSRATVERRETDGAWQDLVTASPDGSGRITIEDRDVHAGRSYGYRLRLASGHSGEVTLDVPSQHRLSLAGFRPNPTFGQLSVAFTLGSSAPARLEVLDLAGRRVFLRAIEQPVAGQRVLPLANVRLAPGVYVLRLEQGTERLVARGVVLR